MAIPTLRELQASLRQLHAHRSNETTARRFYTDGFRYLVEGKAKCWWCRLETQGVATEMLQLFSIQKTTHTEQFKQALAEQLTSCPNCVYAYYNAKRVLYKRYCQIYEPKNVDLVFNGIEKWDEQRILLQFSRALLPDSVEGRMALIEALAGAENLLFHPDIESAACSFICQVVKKGIRVDTGNRLLPGQITLCFARNQQVRAWARHSLKRLGKDARLSSEIMQLLFSGLLKQAADSISAPKTLLPATDSESRASSITFMYSVDSIWEGLHEVFARLDKSSMQDLVEHFDGLPVLTQRAVVSVSGPELFDALRAFSKVIGGLESSQVWTKISAATQTTPKSFVEHLFGRDEMHKRILECSTAPDDLGEKNLMLCNRHFRPVSDWITPFIGSLELPADAPVVVTLLNELILRIRSDAKVPLTSAALAVHTGIAIIMHCLKLPPAKNLDSCGRFILADFLNQHIQIFVDIAQGRSALSGSELLITSTEELIDLMIREELDWSLTTVSDISDQAQALCRISDSQSALDIELVEHPPVLSHFTALWPAVLQDPENTIVFKQTLYGASYMLLFDPLPANMLSCLPSSWRQVYAQFEAQRANITSMLKQLLETVSASLENVEVNLRNELEKDILLTQMRLLVSPAKSIYSEVLRVLRVSMLDGSDDDFDQEGFKPSRGGLELTDSERDMACSELYERHGEALINCLTGIVHDCRVLVSYNRPAYSCCKNTALITRSLLSIFSGSKLPQVTKSLAQLFYGFCGLLGSILKLNTENVVLLGESDGVYVTAITAVFRTVYDMLTSAEFGDFVHLAKNGQGVNEDEAMDALSTCVSQMLIYLQREDVLEVGSQIVRTFGLVASGLAAIPGASMIYPEQLVQDLIVGKVGYLIPEQRKLLKVITSKPVWQARRVAVSETKPVQIIIDEVEAFAMMDSFDLSDVFDDVSISQSSAAPQTVTLSPIGSPLAPKHEAAASQANNDQEVIVIDPHTPTKPDAIIMHDSDFEESGKPKRTVRPQPLVEPRAESLAKNQAAKEVVFTAADATAPRRKQSSMDSWITRGKPSQSLTSRMAAASKVPSARTAAPKSKSTGNRVIDKMRNSFMQERSAILPTKAPNIPKQTVKRARALPSVPAEFWMHSRFGDPYAPTTTITTVRDVSKKALEERERELKEQEQKRAEKKVDSDSSSDEDSPGQGGLAGLISLGRSGRTPRRTTKLLPFSEGASADTIKFGGPQARERAQAKQQAKMRLAPSMAALHKHILSWKYDDDGEMPPSVTKDTIKKMADQYDSCQQYQATLEPLFLLECWAQFQKAKEETTCSDTVVAELKSHMCENQFRELTFEVTSADAQALSDGDVLVFAEGISREKQLAQGVRNGGSAKRFSGERTFLAVVKKRQLGRQTAQIVVYVYFEGVLLAQNLNRLVLNSTWEYFSIFGLTPIYREFAALQSLPYLNEALVQEILQPRPTISRALSSMDVRACMKAHSLNQPQAESVMAALQREQGFTLIQGPPGTGKTKTILGLAGALLSTRKPNADVDSSNKLLICAPSNAAVDEIVKRLKCGIRDNQGCTYFPRVVRVGQAENVSSTVRDTTLDFLTDQAMNAKHEYKEISKAQSELLLDIASRTQAASTTTNAKSAQREAQEEQRALRKRLDEANAELRELDNQRQDIDPSNTAAQMEIRAKYQRIIEVKRSTVQSLDQQRARSREANKAMDQARHNVRMQILQRTDVLCCTLSGSGHELLTSLKCTFDTVIIDEAAQSIELACLIPLKYECERCILVGDPNQLPPTVFSLPATQHLYNQSLFVRIQRNAPDAVNLLSIQYRMHPEISALPSKLFYDSRLKDGPDMAIKQHAVWHDSGKFRPFMFFDISGREQAGASHSVFNMDEVNAAVQLVYNLCHDFPGLSWNQKIGVITPYKQQLRRLIEAFRGFFGSAALDAIEFNTVDGFQGQEKEVIIFSCVRAGDAGVGFLADRRRMNVGLTRARKSLFVLGNANKLTTSPIWRELISETRTRGLLFPAKLPLFGCVPKYGKFDNLLVASAADEEKAADGEGNRAEFTMEELDECQLKKFNETMVKPVQPVKDTPVSVPPEAGIRAPPKRQMHPALREVTQNARKRSRERVATESNANSEDTKAEDLQSKRQKQVVDEPKDVAKEPEPANAAVQATASRVPPKLPAPSPAMVAERKERQRSCLFIPKKRVGGARSGGPQANAGPGSSRVSSGSSVEPARAVSSGNLPPPQTSLPPTKPVLPVSKEEAPFKRPHSPQRTLAPIPPPPLSSSPPHSSGPPPPPSGPPSPPPESPPPPPPPGPPPAHLKPNTKPSSARARDSQPAPSQSKRHRHPDGSKSTYPKSKHKRSKRAYHGGGGGLFRPAPDYSMGTSRRKRTKKPADTEDMITEMLHR